MEARLRWANMSHEERTTFCRDAAAQDTALAAAERVRTTKSAILGFAHRGGIVFRGTSGSKVNPNSKRQQRLRPKVPYNKAAIKFARKPNKKVEAKPPAIKPPPTPPEKPKANIMTVKRGRCHFPYFADARGKKPEELLYCGHRTASEEQTYCAWHERKMFAKYVAAAKQGGSPPGDAFPP